MYGPYKFGKAYQEEMLRIAGGKDEHEFEGIIQSIPRRQGLMGRIFGGLFGRKKNAQPASQMPVRRPRRTIGGEKPKNTVPSSKNKNTRRRPG
jgi:hypothetical protein